RNELECENVLSPGSHLLLFLRLQNRSSVRRPGVATSRRSGQLGSQSQPWPTDGCKIALVAPVKFPLGVFPIVHKPESSLRHWHKRIFRLEIGGQRFSLGRQT